MVPAPFYSHNNTFYDLTADEEEEPPVVEHIDLTVAENDNDCIIIENDEHDVIFIEDDDDISQDVEELSLEEFREAQQLVSAVPTSHRKINAAVSPYGAEIRPGSCVSCIDDTFFFIKHVIEDLTGKVYVRGVRLIETKNVHRTMSKKTGEKLAMIIPCHYNELCMLLKTVPNKLGTPLEDRCLSSMPLGNILCMREIVFTNEKYSKQSHKYTGTGVEVNGAQFVQEHGVLFCRWKFTEEIDTLRKKVVGFQFMPLHSGECTPGKSIPECALRKTYGTNRARQSTSKCTFGDICAGGGGASRGVHMSEGFDMRWAVDRNEVAVETLKLNRMHTKVIQADIREFVRFGVTPWHKVDYIHISFPCQGHSKQNRNQNPELDLQNNAVGMILDLILKNLRPRVVTMEQTDGILFTNEGWWFRRIVHDFTSNGYGVRWSTFRMDDYGVATKRRRLFVMATCPGQKMPHWPSPTHGPGLQPPVTYNQAVGNIPHWATRHNIQWHRLRQQLSPRNLHPIDGDSPLHRIICCQGIMALDPSGTYWPTYRQQMRTMSFPDNHILAGRTQKEVTTQIGNAVAPLFQRHIANMVRVTLDETDLEMSTFAQVQSAGVIVVD